MRRLPSSRIHSASLRSWERIPRVGVCKDDQVAVMQLSGASPDAIGSAFAAGLSDVDAVQVTVAVAVAR